MWFVLVKILHWVPYEAVEHSPYHPYTLESLEMKFREFKC